MLAFTGLLAMTGCSKSGNDDSDDNYLGLQNDCGRLRNAIVAGNKEEVKQIFTQLIYNLPSRKYNKENIEVLMNIVNGQCGNPVTILCYNCVDTRPLQTEISISFVQGNAVSTRVIDLSQDTDGNIVFFNMHD